MHQRPADYVIHLFGGIRPLARALEVEPSTVWRWKAPRERGGSDGEIPRTFQRRLLGLARERGLELCGDDLIEGRTVGA